MATFRADPMAARLAVAAEGMTLLYHRPSGTTHILLPPAPEILDALAAGPADIATIASRLAAEHAMDDAGDTAEVIAARLAELAAAGLVTPAA